MISLRICCHLLALLSVTRVYSVELPLDTLFKWNLIGYDLPWDSQNVNVFRPENTVATGLEVGWQRIFVATPRLRTGVAATLSTIPKDLPAGSSPLLRPYPDWSFHTAGVGDINNCTGLISVYRIRADSCNRLWVLDSGIMDSLDTFEVVCPPKILIFDMASDRVVRSVTFPKEVLRPSSLLTNIIIDETTSVPEDRCEKVFVYISDTAAPALVVYDAGRDLSWRLTHPSMYPDPDFSDYDILGEKFSLMDGIVGLGFSPKSQIVYFQPLATDRLFSISSTTLRAGPTAFNVELPIRLVGKKSSQGLGLAVDAQDDTVYFSTLTETALASWNPHTNQHNLLAYDPTRLQFAAEVRLPDRDPGFVWILSSRFQKYFLRNVSPHEPNIRILRIPQTLQQLSGHQPGLGGSYVDPRNAYTGFNNTIIV